jgi:hypothetical protein
MSTQPNGQATTPRPSDTTTTIAAVMYRAWGPICGGCRHRHRTIATAQRCCDAHHRGVRRKYRGGAYSDRDPVRWDGRPLDEVERRELSAIHHERWSR